MYVQQRESRLGRSWTASRAVGIPTVVGLLAPSVALGSGWPYWHGHTILASLAVLMAVSLGVAGALLTFGVGSQKTGLALITAALLYGLAWLGARDKGALPLLSEFAQSIFFLVLGVGILLHGRPRFESRLEWFWTGGAFVVLVVQQAIIIAVTAPEDLGYDPDVVWPNLGVSASATDSWLMLASVGYGLLALAFVAVLAVQRRRLHGTDRRRGYPLLVVSGLFAIIAALIQLPIMEPGSSLDNTMTARGAQGASAIMVPLALFASAIRAKWEEQTLAWRVIRRVGQPDPTSVERALRDVLDDPTLKMWLWLPTWGVFVDDHGRVYQQAQAANPQHDVSKFEIRTASEEPLAICTVAAGVRRSVVQAAIEAATPAMKAAQLQMEQVEQVRSLQDRIMEAEQEGRRKLARDLHDGVQQSLAALRLDLRRLMRNAPQNTTMHQQLFESSERISTTINELRDITRGLHPPTLSEHGLAGALEEAAEGLGGQVRLNVPPQRLHPRVELALYYVLIEALTNAVKHARARTIEVGVDLKKHIVVGRVTDDGIGEATVTLGGGLHGVDDRVRAMRGHWQLDSAPGRGTSLTVEIPLSEPPL